MLLFSVTVTQPTPLHLNGPPEKGTLVAMAASISPLLLAVLIYLLHYPPIHLLSHSSGEGERAREEEKSEKEGRKD